MTPDELSDLLRRNRVSTRLLAGWLNVSPMWVSRRRTGETPITPDDERRIRQAILSDVATRFPQ